jgi:hypothetical protein
MAQGSDNKILGSALMEEDDAEEVMPEEDSPDEDGGFQADHSIHDRPFSTG